MFYVKIVNSTFNRFEVQYFYNTDQRWNARYRRKISDLYKAYKEIRNWLRKDK
jgi:hypothetical protein